MDLCTRFEGEGGAMKKLDASLSARTDIHSKDNRSMCGVSKLSSDFKQDVKMDPQPSNFSSLRDIWEPRENKPARKPVLVQRKIILSNTGFSLVRSSPNNNNSAGKRNRPG